MSRQNAIYLDVDGVVNALASNLPTRFERAYLTSQPSATSNVSDFEVTGVTDRYAFVSNRKRLRRNDLLDRPSPVFRIAYDPSIGARLLDFADRTDSWIVWSTTWGDAANQWISPLVGLPSDLDVVSFPHRRRTGAGHWKTAHIVTHARERGVRRAVWFDDEARRADRSVAPDLLLPIAVGSGVGLRDCDIERAEAFLRTD